MPIVSDAYGLPVTVSDHGSVAAWNDALGMLFRFRGDPIGAMPNDPAFVLGPVFCGALQIIGGAEVSSPGVQAAIQAARAARPGAQAFEQRHADALEEMAVGNFRGAGEIWDGILATHPNDMLALKCAHETYFLAGDSAAMRRSAEAVWGAWSDDMPGYHVAAGQLGFAQEETGAYREAERWGRIALEMAPEDCWALHCLAHVFEMENRHPEAMALLTEQAPIWETQNLFNGHIWWHMSLRLIEAERYGDCLDLHDRNLADADPENGFRLTDGTALLWRLELAGVDVGARWRNMADRWAGHATRHVNGFLDLHAAMAFARCPEHPAADLFFDSLLTAHDGGEGENAAAFREVVRPLAEAIRRYPSDRRMAGAALGRILPDLHRIGGSIAQREIVERSYSAALLACTNHCEARRFLDAQACAKPRSSWVMRERARLAEAEGRPVQAALLHRRAELALSA